MKKDNLEHVNALAEEIGGFIEYWGFKSIHGKVWTHLYLSPQPLDASELMARLKISKSLASITINDLLRYGVIVQKGKGPKDTQVYTVNPDVREVILRVLKEREAQMMNRLQDCFSKLAIEQKCEGPDERFSIERMTALGQLIDQGTVTLSAMIDLRPVEFDKLTFRA
jgi:DNA-binding transcriptional regulator GbsR (MarR family)